MENLYTYIVLPQSAEDFVRIGDNPDSYFAIIETIATIKEVIKPSTILYDSNNFVEFISNANQIIGGIHNFSLEGQLRNIIGRTSTDINTARLRDATCMYMKWNSDFTHEQIQPVLQEAAESILSKPNTIVLNIDLAFSCERDTLNVIKDHPHKNELPILIRIPVFDSEYDLKEWISFQAEESSFSLRDKSKFRDTGKIRIKQRIYLEIATGRYWYFDYFHKDNKQHFEVFLSTGEYFGEANLEGIITQKDENRSISHILG